jgi:nucleotidyltransferase substrate binding protein (TIGR01987 family)
LDELSLWLRLESARQAVGTLEEVLSEPPGTLVRDAAVKRFEYSFEAVWKLVQAYMREREGSLCNSPKSCFREAMRVGLLDTDEVERSLEMTDDRNRTTHTYQLKVAQSVFERARLYLQLLSELTRRIAQRLETGP